MGVILFGSFGGSAPVLGFSGGSAPVPRGTFPSPEKYPKGRIREGPFRWGPSLMYPTPATTQRGLAPFGNPRLTSGLSVRRWKRLPGLTGLGENPKRGPQPPHWSLRGVVLRRGTQSKVSPSYACFCQLFPRGKSWSGCGAESPIKRGPGTKPPKRRECLSPRCQEHATVRPPGRQTPPAPAALPGWSPPSRTRR